MHIKLRFYTFVMGIVIAIFGLVAPVTFAKLLTECLQDLEKEGAFH